MLSLGVFIYFMLSLNVIIFYIIIWCCYLFNVIWCYHFSQFANVIIFVLSFFLVQHGCYHWCYHLMLSFFVIISPFFLFPENVTHSHTSDSGAELTQWKLYINNFSEVQLLYYFLRICLIDTIHVYKIYQSPSVAISYFNL